MSNWMEICIWLILGLVFGKSLGAPGGGVNSHGSYAGGNSSDSLIAKRSTGEFLDECGTTYRHVAVEILEIDAINRDKICGDFAEKCHYFVKIAIKEKNGEKPGSKFTQEGLWKSTKTSGLWPTRQWRNPQTEPFAADLLSIDFQVFRHLINANGMDVFDDAVKGEQKLDFERPLSRELRTIQMQCPNKELCPISLKLRVFLVPDCETSAILPVSLPVVNGPVAEECGTKLMVNLLGIDAENRDKICEGVETGKCKYKVNVLTFNRKVRETIKSFEETGIWGEKTIITINTKRILRLLPDPLSILFEIFRDHTLLGENRNFDLDRHINYNELLSSEIRTIPIKCKNADLCPISLKLQMYIVPECVEVRRQLLDPLNQLRSSLRATAMMRLEWNDELADFSASVDSDQLCSTSQDVAPSIEELVKNWVQNAQEREQSGKCVRPPCSPLLRGDASEVGCEITQCGPGSIVARCRYKLLSGTENGEILFEPSSSNSPAGSKCGKLYSRVSDAENLCGSVDATCHIQYDQMLVNVIKVFAEDTTAICGKGASSCTYRTVTNIKVNDVAWISTTFGGSWNALSSSEATTFFREGQRIENKDKLTVTIEVFSNQEEHPRWKSEHAFQVVELSYDKSRLLSVTCATSPNSDTNNNNLCKPVLAQVSLILNLACDPPSPATVAPSAVETISVNKSYDLDAFHLDLSIFCHSILDYESFYANIDINKFFNLTHMIVTYPAFPFKVDPLIEQIQDIRASEKNATLWKISLECLDVLSPDDESEINSAIPGLKEYIESRDNLTYILSNLTRLLVDRDQSALDAFDKTCLKPFSPVSLLYVNHVDLIPTFDRSLFNRVMRGIAGDVLRASIAAQVCNFPDAINPEDWAKIEITYQQTESRLMDEWPTKRLLVDVQDLASHGNNSVQIREFLDEKFFWMYFRVQDFSHPETPKYLCTDEPTLPYPRIKCVQNGAKTIVIHWLPFSDDDLPNKKIVDRRKDVSFNRVLQLPNKKPASSSGWAAAKVGLDATGPVSELTTLTKAQFFPKGTIIKGTEIITKATKSASKVMRVFKKILDIVSSFGKVIGPIASLISGILSLFEDDPTQKIVDEMREGFKGMHQRFNELNDKLDDVKVEILSTIQSEAWFSAFYISYFENVNIPRKALQSAFMTCDTGIHSGAKKVVCNEVKTVCKNNHPATIVDKMYQYFISDHVVNFPKAIDNWIPAKTNRPVMQLLAASFLMETLDLVQLAERCHSASFDDLPIGKELIQKERNTILAVNMQRSAKYSRQVKEIHRVLFKLVNDQLYNWIPKMELDVKNWFKDMTKNGNSAETITKNLEATYAWNTFSVMVYNTNPQTPQKFPAPMFISILHPDYSKFIEEGDWRIVVSWGLQDQPTTAIPAMAQCPDPVDFSAIPASFKGTKSVMVLQEAWFLQDEYYVEGKAYTKGYTSNTDLWHTGVWDAIRQGSAKQCAPPKNRYELLPLCRCHNILSDCDIRQLREDKRWIWLLVLFLVFFLLKPIAVTFNLATIAVLAIFQLGFFGGGQVHTSHQTITR